MNAMETEAAAKAMDSLTNFEAVKVSSFPLFLFYLLNMDYLSTSITKKWKQRDTINTFRNMMSPLWRLQYVCLNRLLLLTPGFSFQFLEQFVDAQLWTECNLLSCFDGYHDPCVSGSRSRFENILYSYVYIHLYFFLHWRYSNNWGCGDGERTLVSIVYSTQFLGGYLARMNQCLLSTRYLPGHSIPWATPILGNISFTLWSTLLS